MVEAFFYLNVLFFAVFTWYSLSNTDSNHKAAAYISIVITFIALLLIVLYHIYAFTVVFSRVKKSSVGKTLLGLLNFIKSDAKSKPGRCERQPPDEDIHQFHELLDMIDRPVNTNDYTPPPGQKIIKPTHSEVVVHEPCLDPEK